LHLVSVAAGLEYRVLNMKATPTAIPDVLLIEPCVFEDERGFFMETWNERSFADVGIDARFVQDNHSRSSCGVLRGLHYQIRHAQGKLVRVIAGEIYDVAVDIRRSSPTFGNWVGMALTAESKQMLWIPPGFAHGFYVISKTAEFIYKCTDFYSPEYERMIQWNDPHLAIEWPIPGDGMPTLSKKDANGRAFREAELFD
jgi:dTDP-4-dehydrorhamnose 3,5-epimerase